MTIAGEECLLYKTFPIQVGIIRATTADADGNLTMEREALTLESLSIATAAHNSGGIVIAQVERIAERGSLQPRQVKVPGVLVDCVVVADPEHHWQTFHTRYNPAYSGEMRVPVDTLAPMELSARKVIARRAAMELHANSVVNLGIGMPEGIASVASEERIVDLMTMTAEPGVIGGIPAGGLDFGAAINTQAVIDQPYQFDFYDGGGLDLAFLGLAQADAQGNLNVSKFGPRLAGAGGFINISQNAKRVVFVGTFNAGGVHMTVERRPAEDRAGGPHAQVRGRGRAPHLQRPRMRASAASRRCTSPSAACCRCATSGLELIEIAPGIDLERDVLAQMDFAPVMRAPPKLMDARIFAPGPMGLREDLLHLPLARRFSYDGVQGVFFANFEGHTVRDSADVVAHPRGRGTLPGATAAQGAGDHRLRQLPRAAAGHRRILRHGARPGAASTTRASRATPPAPSCASSSARRCASAAWRRTSSRVPSRRARICSMPSRSRPGRPG